MGIFGGYRADRLIAEVRESGDPNSAKARAALTKLQTLGPNAIKPIVDALATSDKRETIAFVETLTPLIDNKSFPLVAQALAEENPRAVAGVAWALASSRNYSAGLLIDLLQNPAISKPAILDVIAAQKNRFNLRELLNAAYNQDPNEKAALFRIAGELVDASSVDELVSRVEGKDTIARTHIIALLARFDTPKVRNALQQTLRDPNKLVRAAALRAIANGSGQVDPGLVVPLLRDPEHDVQNPAIELLCRSKHPDTVRHLVEILKDENEHARRAAVEGAERRRRRKLREVPAEGRSETRTGGCAAARGRARQDRRPAGHQRGARARSRTRTRKSAVRPSRYSTRPATSAPLPT
jgi:HEAT repeat protein